MSENEEYPAQILFSDLHKHQHALCLAIRHPILQGAFTQYHKVANGQQTHSRHALHINSVALLQQVGLCLCFPTKEEQEEEQEEVEWFGFI